jgi:rhomboid protease GluP
VWALFAANVIMFGITVVAGCMTFFRALSGAPDVASGQPTAIFGVLPSMASCLVEEASECPSDVRVLITMGSKVNVLIARGEYWRLLTAAFLHIGIMHLLLNMFALLSLGRMAELIFGHKRFIALYFTSALTGSLLSYLFSGGIGAGASGAIFGIFGALVVFFARNRKVPGLGAGEQLFGFLVILIINAVYGVMQSNVDNFAHLGGLLGGALVGGVLSPKIKMTLDEEGAPTGLQKSFAPSAAWVVVPAVLSVVVIGVTMLPGARLR